MPSLSGSWQRGFDAAKAASLLSNGPQVGYQLGAALYAGSNLLSVGHNIWGKTTPRSSSSTYNGNVHAEMMALVRRFHYDRPNNLILYISRTNMNSRKTAERPGCSRPCKHCMDLIKLSGVRRVRFYNEFGHPVEIKL
jgi:deoxycytidylate deaminase